MTRCSPPCEATDLTEIARAGLASVGGTPCGEWGREQTAKYTNALRDTMKGLLRGTVVTRAREDLGPGLQMATSGRHCIFFEADDSRILVVCVLHDRMDYRRHLSPADDPGDDT